jgi:hypothetical protein
MRTLNDKVHEGDGPGRAPAPAEERLGDIAAQGGQQVEADARDRRSAELIDTLRPNDV